LPSLEDSQPSAEAQRPQKKSRLGPNARKWLFAEALESRVSNLRARIAPSSIGELLDLIGRQLSEVDEGLDGRDTHKDLYSSLLAPEVE
jgi:hypothetical protein